MHYVYSYILTEFGDAEQLNAHKVWERWRNTRYFSSLYHELDEDKRAFITKIGGDPDAILDRAALRRTFDEIVLANQTITRRELVAAIFYSYAVGLGRDLEAIKYVMTTDSISLRYENAMDGFSGRIVDIVVGDYPEARLVHLERDPRAGLASSIHQFINQLGNMYGLRLGNFWRRLSRLMRRDFDWDSVFVFGFWLIYFRQTYKAIMRKRDRYEDRFITVRNEDLNLKFAATTTALAEKLNIDVLCGWTEAFRPTMLGAPWTGTGAYNSQYQKHTYGPLENDPDKVSRNVTGPNAYVTQRWKTRLSDNEIFIIEALLASELETFGYEFMLWRGSERDKVRLARVLWKPMRGELPSLRWLLNGRHVGIEDLADRVFYCIVFPVFYVASRRVFLELIRDTEIFGRK